MERWQGERIKSARSKLDAFIKRAHDEIATINRQIAEAERARKHLAALEEFP